jgi:fructose-bisphosphate aldolase, class II
MLVSLTKVLKVAKERKFAVGAFNAFNLETVQAIIGAAEEVRAPVIVQTSEKAIEYAGGMDMLVSIIRERAENSSVPVVLHLDHGRTHEVIEEALESGYTSIMFDGANLSYQDNVIGTKYFVLKAHRRGISVEAELGRLGGVEDAIHDAQHLTDPLQAIEFVRDTHCDALAVSIGNRHGKPSQDEKLDLDLLQRIHEAVSIPLVLHGASSTPRDVIRKVIERGVTKINIDTDLRLAFTDAERRVLNDKDIYDPREVLTPAREAVFETVKEKIHLFGGHLQAKYI